MKNYKLHLSEGVRDYIGNELLIKEKIENDIKELFSVHGYTLVQTPTFEYIDVYTSGGIQMPSLYNLINRDGEVLALRNDMTSSIARIVSTRDNNEIVPKRYSYVANTFRYPRLYQGKSHEFTQAGIEIIGSDSIYADIECIMMASKALNKLNINNYMIHIGSSEFIENLFKDLNIDSSNIKELLTIIENKDFVALSSKLNELNVKDNYAKLIKRIMLNAGKINFINSVIDELDGFKSQEILIKLKKFYLELLDLGLENKILFDFSIYSYANYYTGIIFEVFVDGITSAVINGGRSDNLLKSFNADFALLGFGLNINLVLDYIIDNKIIEINNIKYLSYANNFLKFAEEKNNEYRNKGIIVTNSIHNSLDEAINFAKANNYDKVIVYENNNVKEINIKEAKDE